MVVAHHRALEEVEGVVGERLSSSPASTQLGLAEHRMTASPGWKCSLAEGREVVELGPVDVGVELDVDAREPPAMPEPHGEVAAPLGRLPSADPGPTLPSRDASNSEEAGEAVVPVVVAGDGVDAAAVASTEHGLQRRGTARACGPRTPATLANGYTSSPPITRIDRPRQRRPQRLLARVGRGQRHVQLRLRQQARHRGRGVEPVAEVAHVVEPELDVSAGGSSSGMAMTACCSRLSAKRANTDERPTSRPVARSTLGAEPLHGRP